MIIGKSLEYIGGFFSIIVPPFLSRYFKVGLCAFYTGWKRKQFNMFKGRMGGIISIQGGKNINVGTGCYIDKHVEIQAITCSNGRSFNPLISIGDNCCIMHDTQLSATNKIVIEERTVIAARTLITDTTHGDFNPRSFTFKNGTDIPDVFFENAFSRELVSKGPVVIEHDVHIGMNCIILPGVTIGHNSVIAASTVVNRSIPPYSLVTGNPCVVRTFSD